MYPERKSNLLFRFSLVILALLAVIGGAYAGLRYTPPVPSPVVTLPALVTPTPTLTPLAPRVQADVPPTAPATATPGPEPTKTQEVAVVPAGGIVYALSPDINSVGWVQAGERGNHFGESYMYTGIHDGVTYHGAMQFDLSFIPSGSTIYSAELELTGLDDEGLVENSSFSLSILVEDIDADWSRHGFDAIHGAAIDETLSPILSGLDLAPGRVNKFLFNAAQRSIIEARLTLSKRISLRLDGLNPEQGWFGWDSGFGPDTQGNGPVLRLGVVPPVATDEAELAGATPTPTPTFVVVTVMPTPENMQTAAAIAPRLTLEATTTGTPTPLPSNWVTPMVVTATPIPENAATAAFISAEATAAVIAFGTSTPTPVNMVIATPLPTATPTPVYIVLQGELPPMTPVPVPNKAVQYVPSQLIGKIAFKSDRSGEERIYVINPDGTGLALLTNCWPYNLAQQADGYSADGRFHVFTKDTIRYRNIDSPNPDLDPEVIRADAPAIYWYDTFYKVEEQLTYFGAGIAYGGAWSPTREQIVFVSTDTGNDEIWVVNRDGSNLLQLTRDEWSWWDKHPSWSPDGNQIVFWSNRTGHGQIFVMGADGSNLYSLSRTGFNDWDPVWIKYPGIPTGESSYLGSLGACGLDNCSAFESQQEAQAFYLANGGPNLDPFGLDRNRDGMACENLLADRTSPF